MKYYINLIKNKKYGAILSSVIFIMFGILVLSLAIFMMFGIFFSYEEEGVNPLAMLIAGLLFIYIGYVVISRDDAEAQDDSDFEVKLIDEKLHIKFKGREFIKDKEDFKDAVKDKEMGFLRKDQNGKSVSWNVEGQIYEYIKHKYRHFFEVQVDPNKILKEDEIISKFNGIKLANEEEKEKYVKHFKNVNIGVYIFFNIMANLLLFLGICGIIIIFENFFEGIVASLMGIIGYFLKKTIIEHKRLVKKITAGKLYIADCYSYDKMVRNIRSSGFNYYIKVTDNNGCYIDKWFEIYYINYKTFKKIETVKAKLYLVEYNNEYILNVYTEDHINKF